jgi:uncharacterized membrane protein YebE (DUF533 family)
MKAAIMFRGGKAKEASRCRRLQPGQKEAFQHGTVRALVAAAAASGYLE